MSDPVTVLDFWLGDIGPEGWYAGGEEIDATITAQFGDLWTALYEDGLEHWIGGTAGTLAYLIVADQFSRNIHRGTALAFATDEKARAAAKLAVEQGWDLGAPEPERQFFYMPFEHSEELADQDFCIRLMQERLPSAPGNLLHAKAHREVIARFGRFPFRNTALGRNSTPEEERFLADGGYMGIVQSLQKDGGE